MRPNIPKEQWEEQQRFHAESLKKELGEIAKTLDDVLGAGNYGIEPNGSVSHKLGDLELGGSGREAIARAQKRLKEIYDEIKKMGPDFKDAIGTIR